MQIHHLNCSTMIPIGGRFVRRGSKAHMVSHCLLIESQNGLILINSGLGLQDVLHPQERLGSVYLRTFRPVLNVHETAVRQVLKLGHKPSDVKHIILTHLDSENIGGIEDFPDAKIHVMQAELDFALKPRNLIARLRYSPQKIRHSESWKTYYAEGEKWIGFDTVRNLKNLPEEIALISLCGHTEGHAGVAIKTDQGWLLHAGNAYFFRGELNQDYSCPSGLRFFQKLMQVNRKMRLLNQVRLRDLAHDHHSDIRIFCSHDPVEFEDLKNSTPRLLSSSNDGFENMLWVRPTVSNISYRL